ncbi:MAG: DUF4116 domain-containing protein, partial [Chlamydiota bacterium]
MTTPQQDFINRQACCFAETCNEKLDELAKDVKDDLTASRRLQEALRSMAKSFFQDPEKFTFDKRIEVCLKASSLKEKMDELVEILKGSSADCPFPKDKLDGEGRPYEDVSVQDQRAIREQVCVSVAQKVQFTIEELSGKRKARTQEVVPDEVKARQRVVLEARAAELRARQELLLTVAGCIQLVTENGMELERLEPIFQNNKDVVLAAVTQNGRALQFAHSRLKNDRQVVYAAIRNTEHALEFVGDDFKNNREQVLALIRENELAMGFGNDELVEDRAFILEAVTANGFVLQLLDETLRNDREIVVRAVWENPEALRFVGREQRAFAEAYLSVLDDGL